MKRGDIVLYIVNNEIHRGIYLYEVENDYVNIRVNKRKCFKIQKNRLSTIPKLFFIKECIQKQEEENERRRNLSKNDKNSIRKLPRFNG